MGIETHKGREGKVDNKNSKTDRQKKKGFVFFCNRKINEEETNPPHNQELIMKAKKPGLRVQDVKQNI